MKIIMKNQIINGFERRHLCAFVFAFALLAQGCNFNFSSGGGGAGKITDGEAQAIVIKTLQNFNRAVQRGDFAEFHQTEVAESAKKELTPEKFNRAFAGFIANRVDIRPRRDAKLIWSPKPAISGNLLDLAGSYPAEIGKTVNFKLQYVKDTGDWDLKFININIS